MLSFNQIALRRGTELLFENVSFTIHRGLKVGLIGANGAGKTSFFELILGELEADLGDMDYPSDLKIAHLQQEVAATDQKAVDYVLGGDNEWVEIETSLNAAEKAGQYDQIAVLHDRMDVIDGYTARARAQQMLAGLGFAQDDFNKSLRSFSGGWRIRLNLARTLMAPSDLLLLDEPTNHLDLDAILWLSTWIRHYQGSMILISHDREFLDETIENIAYLYRQTIELFSGNYSQFEIVKAARLSEQQSNYEKQQREIKHMQDFVRRFRAKATKARQAQSRIKALERMELIAPAHIDSPFKFVIPPAEKSSNPLLSLDQAELGYDLPVLHDVRLNLHPGDRIGLLGHNGAGKSTLIKSLSGLLPMLAGERHDGANLVLSYFSQHQVDDLALSDSAFNHIFRLDRSLRDQVILNFLGGFDFQGDKVYEPVSTFSGGEKARLALAIVTFTKPNLLLLDEPTNHLDMDMRQALTIALQEFDGAILLVSHDRHLLASTVDTFLLVENGSIQVFEGDLEDYRQRMFAGNMKQTKKKSQAIGPKSKSSHREVRQLRSRLKTLESLIDRLQRKLSEVESELAENKTYDADKPDNLQNLIRDQIDLKEDLEPLEEEWFQHTEALELIQANHPKNH
jgi:ATP-binding cassette subfamily F protein 3